MASGQRQYLIIVTDYFSKWVEAEVLARITEEEIQKFVWTNIICRYGIPNALIANNGSQFIADDFRAFCTKYEIDLRFASVEYPQVNGQAESTNKIILNGIRKRLHQKKGKWPEELPHVLWAHRTTYKNATGETPYNLAFGTEAVIPVEMAFTSTRTDNYDPETNEACRRMYLDQVSDLREQTNLRNAENKRRIANFHNKRIRARTIEIGDKVLKKNQPSKGSKKGGKLAANWLGPYYVTGCTGHGSYTLAEEDGKPVPRTWNIRSLKKYLE